MPQKRPDRLQMPATASSKTLFRFPLAFAAHRPSRMPAALLALVHSLKVFRGGSIRRDGSDYMKTLLPSLGLFVLSSRTPREGVHCYKCQVLRRGAITDVFLCDYRRSFM